MANIWRVWEIIVIQLSKMAEGQEESSKKITVTVKTPKEKQLVEIEEDASIKDVSFSWVLFNYFVGETIHI